MSDESEKKLATEEEARQVAEFARETEWKNRSFARGIYNGKLDLSLIHPLPEPDPELEARADEIDEFIRWGISDADGRGRASTVGSENPTAESDSRT